MDLAEQGKASVRSEIDRGRCTDALPAKIRFQSLGQDGVDVTGQ
jgi:hypothetical protein